MLRAVVVCCLWLLLSCPAFAAADYPFPATAVESRAELDRAMPTLAGQVVADYADSDRVRYLGTAARLQIVAGQYPQALASIEELRRLSPLGGAPQQRATMAQYEIYAASKQLQARERIEFDGAFRRSFETAFGSMDDRAAAIAMRGFGRDQFNSAGSSGRWTRRWLGRRISRASIRPPHWRWFAPIWSPPSIATSVPRRPTCWLPTMPGVI